MAGYRVTSYMPPRRNKVEAANIRARMLIVRYQPVDSSKQREDIPHMISRCKGPSELETHWGYE